MAEGDDPRDPSTASGMPQPWPVVDKRSTYQHPPAYGGSPQRPPYPAPGPPARRSGGSRWIAVSVVVLVLVALLLWLLLR
jgi:hypothetical protein